MARLLLHLFVKRQANIPQLGSDIKMILKN